MEIKNVKCCICGTVGYNPSVPKGHVIDTCGSPSCVSKQPMIIGFKDGLIINCSISNLYRVAPEVYAKPMIDSSSLSQEEIDLNDIIAKAKYHLFNQEYDSLQQILKLSEIADTPEADYLQSKIYFRKLNNTARGVKFLKSSAEKGLPEAMAEYGYIIANGLYGTTVKVQDGLDYLYAASQAKEPLSGSYLADIYQKGIYKGTDFDSLTYKDWFQLLELGLITGDPMVYIVLGTFYYNGYGCESDEDKAIEYLRYAAQNEYVLGMFFLIRILYAKYLGTLDLSFKEEIIEYGKYYLQHAADKDCNEYKEVKNIYGKLL